MAPKLAVIGVGDYYRMFHRAIATWFDVVAEIDKGDYPDEPGGLATAVRATGAEAAMILTPNRLHAKHILELEPLGIPLLVEKPLVTTLADLERVVVSAKANPRLYCSDYFVDVAGVPLLRWLGRPHVQALAPYVAGDASGGFEKLGPVHSVEAILLESTGPKSSFEGREWLWDKEHGGVIWDLAYHHLALWFASFDEGLSVESVHTRRVEEGLAETYADIALRSASGTSLRVEVGKYADRDEISFTIRGEKGTARMEFRPNGVLFEGEPVARLEGDFAEHVCQAFRAYVESGTSEPYGFEAAKRICETIFHIRALEIEEP
jgi:predicted dehydrogenase